MGVLPILLKGFGLKAYADAPLLRALSNGVKHPDRVFVVIQLNGGNDGLNTIIPLDQYSNLARARQNILIPENKVLKLDGDLTNGFHPAMKGLQNLYNEGKINIVQSVGYPNPDFSHFRSTDIWLTAADSNQYLSTGWAGRFLADQYQDYPEGYPNAQMPDPPALQIGSLLSPMLQGPVVNMGMTITSTSSFYDLVNGIVSPAPNTKAGKELTYVRTVAQQTQLYTNVIKEAAGKATNLSTLYPNNNPLADQLKIVAQLIAGGLQTKLYVVNLNGFDTHASQVTDDNNTETGAHATLLSRLSDALAAFQDDLKLLNIEDRVAGMTFSEFGRRVASNASMGTDHGAAAPLIVFGKEVNPGFIGTNPLIPAQVRVEDNVPMQFDFRQVYTSVLTDWFGAEPTEVQQAVNGQFNILPIFKKTTAIRALQESVLSFDCYPNPCQNATQFRLQLSTSQHVEIRIFNALGEEVAIALDKEIEASEHLIPFNTQALPNGNYYCVLHAGMGRKVYMLVKV